MSSELWFAEGVTSYYGPLVIQRAGLSTLDDTLHSFGFGIDAVVNGPGRRFRSAAEASRMAPFVDSARSVDRTNFGNTYISYYTFGAAIGLGLDLSLRDRTDGTTSLDDYMRAMWRVFGEPGRVAPGLRRTPVHDGGPAEARLAEVAGTPPSPTDFFDRYIEGRDVVDYATLLSRAGAVLRRRHPGRGSIGNLGLDRDGDGVKIGRLVAPGTPWVHGRPRTGRRHQRGERQAGGVDGGRRVRAPRPATRRARGGRVPPAGDGLPRDGDHRRGSRPGIIVSVEAAGGKLTPAQQTFRDKWLGSKVK